MSTNSLCHTLGFLSKKIGETLLIMMIPIFLGVLVLIVVLFGLMGSESQSKN